MGSLLCGPCGAEGDGTVQLQSCCALPTLGGKVLFIPHPLNSSYCRYLPWVLYKMLELLVLRALGPGQHRLCVLANPEGGRFASPSAQKGEAVSPALAGIFIKKWVAPSSRAGSSLPFRQMWL